MAFALTNNERTAILEILGYILERLGTKDDISMFDDLRNELTNEDIDRLETLYDLFNDTYTYNVINSYLLEPDLDLLIDIFKYIEDKNLWNNNYSILAYDKFLSANSF